MTQAVFRFYAELNELLPHALRHKAFAHPIHDSTQSVKHLVEANGVPHTEVDLILANGDPVPFSYLVQPGDRISIYPTFRKLSIQSQVKLRPAYKKPPRFLLDNHLGKLARLLRLLGIDTQYFNNRYDDAELAQMAFERQRILLSRDRGLLMRSIVVHGYCLRTTDSLQQVKATINRFNLFDQIRPWRRCLRCNGLLRPVPKSQVLDRLEPKTRIYYHEFQICEACEQIYWKGSHFNKLENFVKEILKSTAQPGLSD
ncbi:MAG: Mut7-C RNAse domain-containing protein [Candidatus Promineifilaceae bacterium]|nr:Mut7-C RNAse domain-containing protein [Candidatus Promineifilaceae bacterium]